MYRAVDQYGQIIDVYMSARRDTHAARRFFVTALGADGEPTEVVTDRAWPLGAVIDELIPAAFHNTEQYANNRIEVDHGRLKARLRPMRGLKRDDSARVIVRGHALMQNIRRGHYELGVDARSHRCVARALGSSPERSDWTRDSEFGSGAAHSDSTQQSRSGAVIRAPDRQQGTTVRSRAAPWS